jgi:hypothetical protein
LMWIWISRLPPLLHYQNHSSLKPEASHCIMQIPAFNLPCFLLFQLETPGLDKGNRGELILYHFNQVFTHLEKNCQKKYQKNQINQKKNILGEWFFWPWCVTEHLVEMVQ